MNEGGHLGALPCGGDRAAQPEPGGVPPGTPRLPYLEGPELRAQGLGGGNGLPMHLVRRDLEGPTVGVDGRAHDVNDKRIGIHGAPGSCHISPRILSPIGPSSSRTPPPLRGQPPLLGSS